MSPLPVIELGARTDPGRDPDKQVNEDAWGHRETRFGHLCVVCDGMGGHAAGREAAELALGTIFETFDAAPDGTPPGLLLKSAMEEASARVHFMRTSEIAGGRPGSTAVALLLHAFGTEVAHIGDSRAYLVHEGQLFRITRDHSMVQELVDRGLLTPQQAARHPDANRITRALGMAPQVDAELRLEPIHQVPGDTFVLCSDGLSDLVLDHEILAVVGSDPAAQAVAKLVDMANARGGHDNITVIVMRAREGALGGVVGLAPTMVQTPGPPASAAQPSGNVTQPLLAIAPVIPRAPEPLPPPPSVDPRPRRLMTPVVFVGLLLAAGAVAMLAVVLMSHLGERAGKTRGHTALNLPEDDAQAIPQVIASGTVVIREAGVPAPPIAPLEPSPAPSSKPR